MNAPRCSPADYIAYQIASPARYTCTEAARCPPKGTRAPAHDAFTRLWQRQPGDTAELWQEAQPWVPSQGGVRVVDDTTLDKPYAREIELVTWHWSGKPGALRARVVRGLNLVSLVWSDGTARIPCDFRVYDKPVGGKTKNEHFRDMLTAAHSRGLRPAYVLCDSGYSGLDNLKYLRQLGYAWLTRLKSNRQVNPDDSGHVAIRDLAIPPQGQQVHLRGYGFVRVFRTVADNGRAAYWASRDLDLTPTRRQELALPAGAIEDYHRGLKQCCGVERAQVRAARAQIAHIGFALRAFLRLEYHRLRTGLSWYETKAAIVRTAVSPYFANPFCRLPSTA